MAHPKRAEVLEQYAAGVSAISQIASQFSADEWHLHAWDLSSPSSRYEAANADQLFVAAGTAMARVTGGLRGRMLGLAVSLAAKRHPWPGLLTRSGRRVTWRCIATRTTPSFRNLAHTGGDGTQ